MTHKNAVVQKQLDGVSAHLTDTIHTEQRRLEKAYNAGVDDGKRTGFAMGVEAAQNSDKARDMEKELEQAYHDGMEVAWEAARKIDAPVSRGGLSLGELLEVFGESTCISDILDNFTAQEVCKKIAEYEKQKEESAAEAKAENEPHLLTIDDFIDNPMVDSHGALPAWIEPNPEDNKGNFEPRWGAVRAGYVIQRDGWMPHDFRYWSGRPTEEQIKAETRWG